MNSVLGNHVIMLGFMTFTEGIPTKLIYSFLRRGMEYVWDVNIILTQKRFVFKGVFMLVQKYLPSIFQICRN